jgi:putative methionine-R-sulfoxide reductase with GAF domain
MTDHTAIEQDVRGSQLLGEMDVDSHSPAPCGPDDQRMLEAVAALVSEHL